MTTSTFTIFFALLIYQVHLANIGKTTEIETEIETESPKSLSDDMQLTRNKIEHSDPTPHIEIATEEKDFEFSGDDEVGEDDADVEYSGDIELMAYNDYDETAKNPDISNPDISNPDISNPDYWDEEEIVGVKVSNLGCDLNSTVSSYVNEDLIEKLKNLRTRCVLYQNANTSNFIIYC